MSGMDGPRLETGGGLHDRKLSLRARTWNNCEIAVGSFLVVVSVFFVLFLQWHSGIAATLDTTLQGSTDTNAQSIPAETEPAAIVPPRDLKVLLHPSDHLSRDPQVQHLRWNITSGELAPDGVVKKVLLINGQFPGPTIEVRSGDVIEIQVFNHLEEGVSLHWHGLHMREANEMDGPVGITQCAIPPRGNFTYRVPTGPQAGTFWYHAHSEVQRGDGLYGGLVIHNPLADERVSYSYDEELLFLVGDWYHRPAKEILHEFMSTVGTGNEPNPSSLLINGLGYFNCSMAVPGAPVNCSDIQRPWMQLNKGLRYRVRLANVGSLTSFSFGIPDAELEPIQVDGGYPVSGKAANSIGTLHPAERIDFIVRWEDSTMNEDTQVIIDLDHEYFLQPNFALVPIQSFLVSANTDSEPHDPQNSAIMTHFDLRELEGAKLSDKLPEAAQAIMIYSAVQILSHEHFRPMGFVNSTSWRPQELPLITVNRMEWNHRQLVPWTGPESVWVDLVINNIDSTGHPFHLHGFDFFVVASYEGLGGWDYYNPFDPTKPPRGGPFNLINPVRKDTVLVPAYGYVVARFYADNEGIWALHCHVLWHQGSGMTMAIQVLGDEHRGTSGTSSGLDAKTYCDTRITE